MIIGTTGQNNHGKTTLIQALTGKVSRPAPANHHPVYPLTLAHWLQAEGQLMGFLELSDPVVWSHDSKWLDHLLLVLAADESLTRLQQGLETLLALPWADKLGFTVALTKIDRVKVESWSHHVTVLHDFLAHRTLTDVGIFPVSAQQGQGITALREHLLALPCLLPAPYRGVRYMIEQKRLQPDRNTIISVSGLLQTGNIQTGDTLMVSPGGNTVQVYALQVQHQPVKTVQATQYCDLDLLGNMQELPPQGNWLLAPQLHAPVERFDAFINLLAESPYTLREGAQVILAHGAATYPARLVLLDKDKARAGEAVWVQCCVEPPLTVFWHDPLTVYDMTGQQTLAVGWVLDPSPPRRGRKQPNRWLALQALMTADAGQAMADLLSVETLPISLADWARAMNLPLPVLLEIVQSRLPDVLILDEHERAWAIREQPLQELQDKVLQFISEFHQQQPDEAGLMPERVRRQLLPFLEQDLFDWLLAYWLVEDVLARTDSFVHLPEHVVALTAEEQCYWQQMEPLLQAGGFNPPWVRDLMVVLELEEEVVRQVLVKQARRRKVYQIVHDLFYTPARIHQLADMVREHAKPQLNVMEFRDSLGIGRKRTIQILEFFDRTGLTRRIVAEGARGKRRDVRVLHNPELFTDG